MSQTRTPTIIGEFFGKNPPKINGALQWGLMGIPKNRGPTHPIVNIRDATWGSYLTITTIESVVFEEPLDLTLVLCWVLWVNLEKVGNVPLAIVDDLGANA